MRNNIILLILLSFIFACKEGPDDPWISLRSRENRLIGYWDFDFQVYDTLHIHLKLDIRKDGSVYSKNYKDSLYQWGEWAWLIPADAKGDRKESFSIEEITHQGIFKFKLLRLTNKEMKVEYQFNNNQTKSISYFNRIDK